MRRVKPKYDGRMPHPFGREVTEDHEARNQEVLELHATVERMKAVVKAAVLYVQDGDADDPKGDCEGLYRRLQHAVLALDAPKEGEE